MRTRIVLIDCDVEDELCREYGVNEYPAIRLLTKDWSDSEETTTRTIGRYRGRKTEHAIRSFLTKHEYPTIYRISSEDQLRDFKKVDDVVIVAFLPADQDDPLQIYYSIAEQHHEDFVFGYTYYASIAEKEAVTVPSIKCYKNTDGDHKLLKGAFTAADVEAFLSTATKTIIGDFSERNMEAYMAPGKLSAYIFATTEDEARALRHELTSLAKKFEQYVTFGVADAVEYAPMAKNFGLVEGRFPALAVHAPMNDNVFTYLQRRVIRVDVVEGMLMTILQGKATTGQVFGANAPEMEGAEAEAVKGQRDEL
ncbi:hypothetical protein BU23DRAFT_465354 [Bimuria novae-zelandiae CBS 107.79]|uniref:protein disulfide-isomerase n=1 Tax=Bimuria novae-zelandiae CBS 107.79 TaxID=1447943 RepID=A0A6A5V8J2_9PLEO|nr:hypothetical protein BU23DRAFT_465354 [Bimuria novae-zelandiae CBS 107.79]